MKYIEWIVLVASLVLVGAWAGVKSDPLPLRATVASPAKVKPPYCEGMAREAVGAPRCKSAPTQAQVDAIYALTYGLVAFEFRLPRLGEFPTPTIIVVSGAKLCELAEVPLDEKTQDCAVGGMERGDRIYLNEEVDWSDPVQATILLHEYVHYFQYVGFGAIESWCENYHREVKAYTVQAEVLMKLPTQYDTRQVLENIAHLIVEYRMAAMRACRRSQQ